MQKTKTNRHPDEGRDPFLVRNLFEEWFPAFAGMTMFEVGARQQ